MLYISFHLRLLMLTGSRIFRLYDKIRMMGGRKGAIILIFRLMAGGLNFKADRNSMRTVLYSTAQYCTVQYCTVLYSTILDLGPCFGMNGHFRRDPDVLSRLPESTIDFLSVFIGFRGIKQVSSILDLSLARNAILDGIRTCYQDCPILQSISYQFL